MCKLPLVKNKRINQVKILSIRVQATDLRNIIVKYLTNEDLKCIIFYIIIDMINVEFWNASKMERRIGSCQRASH